MRSTGAGLTAVGIAVMNGLTGCKAAGSAIAICDPVISFTTQGPVMTKPDTVGWHEGNCHCPICDDTTKQKARESARAAGNSVLVPADKLKDMQTLLQAAAGTAVSLQDEVCDLTTELGAWKQRALQAEEAIERVRVMANTNHGKGSFLLGWKRAMNTIRDTLTPPNEEKDDG